MTQRETASMVCGRQQETVVGGAARKCLCTTGSRLAGSSDDSAVQCRQVGGWPVRAKQNSRAADANWVGRRFGQVGELRLWPERRLVVQVAEKQSRMQRVRIEGRLRRVDACWADAGCEGGGMRSRDFVGAQG